MGQLAKLLVGLSLLAGTGCSSISVIAYTVDEERSGKTRDQVVNVSFVGPGAGLGSSQTKLPKLVVEACTFKGQDEDVQEMALIGPVASAAGQLAFSALTSAIDSRREQLAEAALHGYGATVIVPSVSIDPIARTGDEGDESKDTGPSAFIPTACIHLTRQTSNKDAMKAVFIVERVRTTAGAQGDEKVKALSAFTLTPAYIKVDLAGAQTRAYPSDQSPKIELSGSVGISAVETDPRTGHPGVSILTNSPFSLGTIELEQAYANPLFFDQEAIEDNDWEALKITRGPMFRPLRESPTVGGVSVSVVETGEAADLDEPGALEKSIRATTRALIGTAIETRFAE